MTREPKAETWDTGRKEENAYLSIEKEAMDRMRDATAPTFAASTAPCDLYRTVSP